MRACERIEFLQILFKELHYQLGITSCAYDDYIGMEAELESREIKLLVHTSALSYFFDILNMHEHTFPLQGNDSYDDYNFLEGTEDRKDLIDKLQNHQVFAMGQWELFSLYYDFLVGLQSINQLMPIYVRVVDAFGANPNGLLVTTDADLMTTYGLCNRYLYNPKAQLENSLEEMISSL